MVLPPLYAIRSHPFRNLRHPNAAHTNSAVCMADLYLHLKSACCGTSVKRCILKSSRVVVVTRMAQVLPIWFALSLSLFSPRHRHFSRGCFSKNNPSKTPLTPRLVPLPGPFMGQLVDHAYVAPRYCTGLEQFLYGTKPIPFRGTGHYECNFWTRCDVKSRLRRGFLAVQGERK